ncbi:hypothetical protein [Ideonella sp. A 288]|uniref:hypothetical protein n=1 Tax=Ideonella sp. A 288 TaxID=1962181 RepID=UPI00118574C5|nr:hypothetical protein [Ideonella sp. A 288]
MATPRPLAGAGLPQERLARLAAEATHAALQAHFDQTLAHLPGHRGDGLRRRVHLAREPGDLWGLRADMARALQRAGEPGRQAQADLDELLARTFSLPGG